MSTVVLPNGVEIEGIPDTATQEEIRERAIAAGWAKESDFPAQKSFFDSLRDNVLGGAETAGTLVSSMAAEPLAGLAGIGAAVIPGGRTGAQAVEDTRSALTYQPRTEAGQDMTRATGEFVAPLGEAFKGAEDFLGNEVFEMTGSPTLAAAAETIPALIAEVAGVGAAKGISKMRAAKGARQVDNMMMDAAPTTEKLREVASGLYREIDEMGVTVHPSSYQRFVKSVQKKAEASGLDPDVTPAASKAVERLKGLDTETITLQDMSTLRAVAQGAAKKFNDPQDAMLGSLIIEEIDNFVGTPAVLKQAPNVPIEAVKYRYGVARELWRRMRSSELLEEAAFKASNQASGFENGLRRQFSSILNNPKQRRTLVPEQIKAMQEVINGKPGSNIMRNLGRLGFSFDQGGNYVGWMMGGGAGYMAGGPAGAVATTAIGSTARQAAKGMTARSANKASAITRAGGNAQSVTKAYLQSTKNPDVETLSRLFMLTDVDTEDLTGLSEFAIKAAELAAKRKAEMAAAAAAGSAERTAADNVLPFAAGMR